MGAPSFSGRGGGGGGHNRARWRHLTAANTLSAFGRLNQQGEGEGCVRFEPVGGAHVCTLFLQGGGGGAPFSPKMGRPCPPPPPPGDTHVYLCSTSQLYVHCLSYTHISNEWGKSPGDINMVHVPCVVCIYRKPPPQSSGSPLHIPTHTTGHKGYLRCPPPPSLPRAYNLVFIRHCLAPSPGPPHHCIYCAAI